MLLLAGGWAYQALGIARDDRKFPMPGRLVDARGARLHLVEAGNGTPAVILEAGIAASSLNWTRLQAEIAGFTRVYSYDRASLGWSDRAVSARTVSSAVDDLHTLIEAAQIPAPFVLAGHSFGGMLVRCYAARFPERVGGLVLLDPLVSEEWANPSDTQRKTLRRAARLSRRGALLARFGIVRGCLSLLSSGRQMVPSMVAKAASRGGGESAMSRLVREVQKMPPETWPQVRAHWCRPKSFLGMASYLESLPASSVEAGRCELPPSIPVTVFSAANSTEIQIAGRDAIARRSLRGKHIIAEKSGHWIHFDEPELVIQAIREMVDAVRTR